MSAVDYRYRVDITCKAPDGTWSVLPWWLTDAEGNRHEAACYWTPTAGEALQVWRKLNTGEIPPGLQGSLDGWAGLVVSGVQQWRRFRRADGWGPWEQHIAEVDGTHEIRTGCLTSHGEDPRTTRPDVPAPIGATS